MAAWKEWVAQYRAVLQEDATEEADRMATQARPVPLAPKP